MWNVMKQPVLKLLKNSVSKQSPALQQGFTSLMRRRSTSRARTVHLGMKHCPGSHALSKPTRMTCLRSQCQRDQRDRILSGQSRNIINKSEDDGADAVSLIDDSKPQSWEDESENTFNSDVSEIAIPS